MVVQETSSLSCRDPLFSGIVAVKDRTERLCVMLPSWLKCNKIFDFVVVDWSSKIPIVEDERIEKLMEHYPRLKIIRVENQDYFYRCKALNLARSCTSPNSAILLKLDADYISIDHGWMTPLDGNNLWYNQKLKTHELGDYFITGSDFSPSSYGFLVVNKWAFDAAGGFNENLLPIWGYEDEDLYSRLSQVSSRVDESNKNKRQFLERIPFFLFENYIFHMPHKPAERKDSMPSQFKELSFDQLIQMNKEKSLIPCGEKATYNLLYNSRNYKIVHEK